MEHTYLGFLLIHVRLVKEKVGTWLDEKGCSFTRAGNMVL